MVPLVGQHRRELVVAELAKRPRRQEDPRAQQAGAEGAGLVVVDEDHVAVGAGVLGGDSAREAPLREHLGHGAPGQPEQDEQAEPGEHEHDDGGDVRARVGEALVQNPEVADGLPRPDAHGVRPVDQGDADCDQSAGGEDHAEAEQP